MDAVFRWAIFLRVRFSRGSYPGAGIGAIFLCGVCVCVWGGGGNRGAQFSWDEGGQFLLAGGGVGVEGK